MRASGGESHLALLRCHDVRSSKGRLANDLLERAPVRAVAVVRPVCETVERLREWVGMPAARARFEINEAALAASGTGLAVAHAADTGR